MTLASVRPCRIVGPPSSLRRRPTRTTTIYADAARLEMAFMGEIRGWGDLQETVRRHLVRACSQHVPPNSVNLDEILESPELVAIRDEIVPVCRELSSVRLERGGKKTYNNMIACYFLDMAQTWK